MPTLFITLFLIISFFSLANCQSNTSDILQNLGEWHLLQENIGISAMHMQLLHNDKVVMFDRTDFGKSNISLPYGRCRLDYLDTALQYDCTAHSVLYDVLTNSFQPLMVNTDTFCSGGAVLPNGTLIETGGFNDGDHVVRAFAACRHGENCDWIEYPECLAEHRWYATNQILPDGRVIIIGGRRAFNYEFFPRKIYNDGYTSSEPTTYRLDFLWETRDSNYEENNLYPFVHLLPDGNLLIFANTRAILLDYVADTIVRELPPIPDGDPHNYPSTGSSVLLPIDENKNIEIKIMICGGAQRGAYKQADQNKVFLQASKNCAKLTVTNENATWTMEQMPMPRVMGDMLLLPSGDVLIINGAELGTAGWENAANPVTTPLIYRPKDEDGKRFQVMSPSPRPRLYHSSAVLLKDGRVLVGGSNPHVYYNFTHVGFPTDLSIEAYSPPYLSTNFAPNKPNVVYVDEIVGYQQPFSVTFEVQRFQGNEAVFVNIIAPSFTTHSLAMNQRMVILRISNISHVSTGMYNVRLTGPSTANIAPPGYYLLYVVHANIPSSGSWIRVE